MPARRGTEQEGEKEGAVGEKWEEGDSEGRERGETWARAQLRDAGAARAAGLL